MRFIYNTSTDAYFNLAAEEYLMSSCDDDIFMLWRNERSVIVGKNQNTYAEVNADFISEHKIKVVRRMTGGGAVFHDPGNVNFTFITDDTGGGIDFSRFAAPVIRCLRKMGIDAALTGRNDIECSGCKISGMAQCTFRRPDGKVRLMSHGTLLFSADITQMTCALSPHRDKLSSKGIKSISARVRNISSFDTYSGPASPDGFIEFIMDSVVNETAESKRCDLDRVEISEITSLADRKYATWEWNYGASGAFSVTCEKRFEFGTLSASYDASGGVIEKISISGDFFSKGDISVLENALVGVRLEPCAITDAMRDINPGNFISGCTIEKIKELLLS